MDTEELLNKSVKGITRNERLRQDFEEEKFRKIFELEMQKLEKVIMCFFGKICVKINV